MESEPARILPRRKRKICNICTSTKYIFYVLNLVSKNNFRLNQVYLRYIFVKITAQYIFYILLNTILNAGYGELRN